MCLFRLRSVTYVSGRSNNLARRPTWHPDVLSFVGKCLAYFTLRSFQCLSIVTCLTAARLLVIWPNSCLIVGTAETRVRLQNHLPVLVIENDRELRQDLRPDDAC